MRLNFYNHMLIFISRQYQQGWTSPPAKRVKVLNTKLNPKEATEFICKLMSGIIGEIPANLCSHF